jgi:hypothetical protein
VESKAEITPRRGGKLALKSSITIPIRYDRDLISVAVAKAPSKLRMESIVGANGLDLFAQIDSKEIGGAAKTSTGFFSM